MKLLFDQNLSPKLVNRLADLFPDSSHVQAVGLQLEAVFRNRFAAIEAFEKDASVGTLVFN